MPASCIRRGKSGRKLKAHVLSASLTKYYCIAMDYLPSQNVTRCDFKSSPQTLHSTTMETKDI